jgi:hypothetical protein
MRIATLAPLALRGPLRNEAVAAGGRSKRRPA